MRLDGTPHSSLLIICCKQFCLFKPSFLCPSSLFYLLDCHFSGTGPTLSWACAVPYATGWCSHWSLLIDTVMLKITEIKWKSNVKYWVLHCSPTFEVKLKTSLHPPWLPIKSQVKGLSCSCNSEIRLHEQPLSKRPYCQFYPCPWDCPGVRSMGACPIRP